MLETIRRAAERWQRRKRFEDIRRAFAESGYPVDHVEDHKIEAALTRNGSSRIEDVPLTAKIIFLAQRRMSAGSNSGRKKNGKRSDDPHHRAGS